MVDHQVLYASAHKVLFPACGIFYSSVTFKDLTPKCEAFISVPQVLTINGRGKVRVKKM